MKKFVYLILAFGISLNAMPGNMPHESQSAQTAKEIQAEICVIQNTIRNHEVKRRSKNNQIVSKANESIKKCENEIADLEKQLLNITDDNEYVFVDPEISETKTSEFVFI